MDTKVLQTSINLIGYRYNKVMANKKILTDTAFDVTKEIVKPFKKELNHNLRKALNDQARVEIITDYLYQFLKFQDFYKEHDALFTTGSLRGYVDSRFEQVNEKGESRRLSDMENYAVFSKNLYDMLLNEMQLLAIKYRINFFTLCYKLKFSLNYFDSSNTSYWINKMQE